MYLNQTSQIYLRTNMNNNGHIYLSKIKYDCLTFISNFIKQNKFSPTYKEIGEHFSFSRARAGAICAELFKLGLISKGKAAHRKIRMTDKQSTQIPTLNFNKEYSTMDLRR